MNRNHLINTVFLVGIALSYNTAATWSIVAVDPESGEVGLAAATCNLGVQFIAAVVPGAGVIAAQAETSLLGRDHAKEQMAKGVGAEQILLSLANPTLYDGWFTAKYPMLQYGVATLNPKPAAGYIGGDKIFSWSGGKSSDTYSVQGNTLRGETVVSEAARVFEIKKEDNCRLTLAERLLRALEAGRDAGGDKRCPLDKPALSAILLVEPPLTNDSRREQSVESIKIIVPKELNLLQGAYYLVMPYSPPQEYVDPVTLIRESFESLGQESCQYNQPSL